MIPSDIKITPLSGSGDSSVSMTMEEYTGRVAKPTREVWVYDTEDTVSDMVEVDQYPKTEFIGLNDPLTFSVVALGGEITVTGTSNSSALKPVEFDEALKFELSINGEVQSSWSPDNPIVTGDIGADEEYSFSLKVTVPENQTTSQKPWTFQLSNNAQIVTATITINQAAGVRTYSDITISEFSYPDASAAGGTLTPTLSYSQTWGWNGQTTGGGTVTSGATLSYEAVEGKDWPQDAVDVSTGIITAPSKGVVVSNQQFQMRVRVYITLNGKNTYQETEVEQEANLPISLTVIIPFQYSSVPISASGGTAQSTTFNNTTVTLTSGSSTPLIVVDETGWHYGIDGVTVDFEESYKMTTAVGFSIDESFGAITAEDRGVTVGNIRSCGNVTRTANMTLTIDVEYGGGTVSGTGEYTLNSPVTQEANIQTQTGIRIEGDTEGTQGWIPYEYWDNINAAGRASDTPGASNTNGWAIRFTGYRQYSYTSGATDEETVNNISHALGAQKNVDWIGYHTYGYVLNKQPDSDNAYRGTTIGNERTAEVWWEDNGFESNHLSITQAKNVPVSGETTQADFSYPDNVIPPSGGHADAKSNGALSLTWSSGATSHPSQPTEGVSYVAYTTYTMTEAEGFSILNSNGRITATGMGSTLGSRSCGNVTRVLHYTVTISDTYGGGSFDTTSLTEVLDSPVTQGVNERIYDTPVITLGTPSDIPASGGIVSSVSILSVVQPLHYTSGETSTVTNPARTNEVWTPVTVGTKGTTTSDRTVAGQLKYSCVCNGVAGSASVDVYQAANRVVSTEWTSASCTVEPSQKSLGYGGGTATFTKSAVKNGTETYTSGATKAITYSAAVWSSSIDYDSGSGWISSVDTQNDIITVSENPYAYKRSATVTITAALNGMSASDTILISQIAALAELDFEESTLGTVPGEGGYVYLTLHSNCNWGLTTDDTSASAAIRTSGSTGTFSPISLTGDTASNSPGDWEVRISFSSTTSSRPLTVIAYSLNPVLSTTLSGTQESGGYLTVSPTSLSFDSDGGTLTLQISSNTSWTIDGTVNPDLQPNIQIVGAENCINCEQCDPVNRPDGPISSCPVGGILEYSNDLQRFEVTNPNPCILCGSCVEALAQVCPIYDATGEDGVGIKLKSQN